ncbi:MAG: sensor domain-containing diguanylate cyclase [Candidatus Omnitrophica bacterium]|nr:sensor domain-containing diguanylate cyclase [Candidatus Omnitrophota bacterium]
MEEIETKDLPVPDVLWYSCDGMMVIDEDRRIIAMNPAMERISGFSREEAVGQRECAVLFACRDMQGCPLYEYRQECPGLKALQDLRQIPHVEYSIRTKGGSRRIVSTSYTPIHLPGHPLWAVAVVRDVTAQKRKERRLAHLAATDVLTGVSNRSAFMRAFLKEIKRSLRRNSPLAVALIDLDRFKGFNDLFGHLAGDEILETAAKVFQEGRRASDLVARWGGDEFSILFPDTAAAGGIVVAQRIRRAVEKFPFPPFEPHKKVPVRQAVTVTIGLSVSPDDGRSPEALLEQADRRLYEGKRLGGNRVIGPAAF